MTESSSRARLLSYWPVVAALVVAVLVTRVVAGQYDVTGHAAGHLSSGLVVFMMAAFLVIGLWAAPEARRSWAVGLASLGYFVGLGIILRGELRVVDAIGDRDWSDDQASALGEAVPGFESGHSLTGRGALIAVLASIVLIWVLRSRRAIPTGLAVGATVASVIFPYWILPGAGVLVLAIGTVVLRARRLRGAGPTAPATVAAVG
jgi:hypothetical protein